MSSTVSRRGASGPNQYARLSALTFQGQPFTLPFKDTAVVHWGTWLYSAPPGNWHHAIDYLRESDWKTFEARLRQLAPRYYITQCTAPTLTNDMYGVMLAKSLGAVTMAFGTHVTAMPTEMAWSTRRTIRFDGISLGRRMV